jgi:RimJ/RimL family protein N-acetyltransferase
MDIQTSLYIGDRIVLSPIDHEKDPEIEAKWTQDAEYLRMLSGKPAMPQSAAQVKKAYEKLEKDSEESKNLFHFAIRTKAAGGNDPAGKESPADGYNPADGQPPAEKSNQGVLIGFVRLQWIEWNHGVGMVHIGIGDPEYRGKGYGTETLRLILRYAFTELNLYRLSAVVQGYNQPALRLFRKAGFVEEVCRRKALHRDGQYWDLVHLGILREEWDASLKRNA